ncbi:MAG: bifunctional 2-polyprenyl-6-hydroxyphenol methylase/3-demethylubiquinol 3-O-methyltransferase UbiG [Gammaproteobacteria bacterium]|jgi:2-polyprenyl-6-hydroxyphenyl methylase/3-demethylubiquinone-9 3-methyltransferase
MNPNDTRVDMTEVGQFARLADRWWDPDGPLRTLHAINPLRLDYINARRPVAGLRILDVGCGGGLLCEGLAEAGAVVTGIDMAEASITVAREHADASGRDVEYVMTDVFELARQQPHSFDVVTCLEVLEHVPDPSATISACAALLKPGGDVFLSTINRNAKSFALAIVAAEYVLGMLPRGTHRYRRLIRPAELSGYCRKAALTVRDLRGLHFNPLTDSYWLGDNVDVNYFCHASADA